MRHCQVSEKRKQPEKLEEETTSKRVRDWLEELSASDERSAHSLDREELTDEDTDEIRKRFQHLDKCPLKADLKLMLAMKKKKQIMALDSDTVQSWSWQ